VSKLAHASRTALNHLADRSLELELLLTSFLLFVLNLATLILNSKGNIQWSDMGAISLFVALFLLLSFALAVRGWGEDQVLIPIVAVLTGFGLVLTQRLEPDLVTRYGGIYRGIAHKQMWWIINGILLLTVISFAPWQLRWFKNYRYSWLVLGLSLIGMTFFWGSEHNGVRLWLVLGVFQFQPVELLKIFLVIYLTTYLWEHQGMKCQMVGVTEQHWGLKLPPYPYLLPILLMWGLTIILIIIQKDLGAATLFFTIFLVMLYLVTERISYVGIGLIVFFLGAYGLYRIFNHVQVRVDAWYNPWLDPLGKGYQMAQALYSLASGGYVGTGLSLGDPTMVPESHTDFALIALGEEMGLLGTLGVLLCYLLFTLRGYQIALHTNDSFQQLLAVGLTTTIAIQVLLITAGTTNLVPLTGITLPFVSYGGSSIVANFVIVGVLLRISATKKSNRVL